MISFALSVLVAIWSRGPTIYGTPLEIRMRRRFDEGDAYFTALSANWSEGVRKVFRELPELEW